MRYNSIFLWFLSVVCLFVLSIPIWLKVDYLPLRMWDESRNAINAIEMYQSHDWLIRTRKSSPETYELKPPLLTWLQVLSLRVFGINELSIRFPSVVFSIGTLVLIFYICFSITKSPGISVFAPGVAATSSGFYGDHVGRFGDHDALLVFFSLFFVGQVYLYIDTQKNKHIYLASLGFLLAVMTKSVSIFLLFPGSLLSLLIYRQLRGLLKNKHFYFAALIALAPIVGYYSLREVFQPGYLSLVWEGELFPRYLNQSKNYVFKNHSFLYYCSFCV